MTKRRKRAKTSPTAQKLNANQEEIGPRYLLDLPVELRFLILGYIIGSRVTPYHPNPAKCPGEDPSHPDLHIALVNRQLYHETKCALYSIVFFSFSRWADFRMFFSSEAAYEPHFDIKCLLLDFDVDELLSFFNAPVTRHANEINGEDLGKDVSISFTEVKSRLNLPRVQVNLPYGGDRVWRNWFQRRNKSGGNSDKWQQSESIWAAAEPFLVRVPDVRFACWISQVQQDGFMASLAARGHGEATMHCRNEYS